MTIRGHAPKLLSFLKFTQSILLLVMIVMFINFNAKIAKEQAATQAIAQSTNSVVKGQADILSAIKAVTDDTHTTAAQQTAIIICMLQVPIESRTTDLQQKCRSQADTALSGSSAGTTQNSTGTNPQAPSSNSTPKSTPAQSENTQNPPSSPAGGGSQPGFLQRNIISPIKNLINAL